MKNFIRFILLSDNLSKLPINYLTYNNHNNSGLIKIVPFITVPLLRVSSNKLNCYIRQRPITISNEYFNST